MSGLFDKLKAVAEGIISLPLKIGEKILEILKDIFVPDVSEIENTMDTMVDNISSQLGVQFNTLDRLFDREAAPEDVNQSYNISGLGTLKLKFFDSSYLIKGVALMRPYIRGFLVLLLVLFHWRNILSLIGQDPGIAFTAHHNYQEWKKGGKEE